MENKPYLEGKTKTKIAKEDLGEDADEEDERPLILFSDN